MPRPKSNKETEAIRRMIHRRLQSPALEDALIASGTHLDEDALASFIEGRLSELEAASIIPHLVACGFCRRITAQLIRLESEIGPTELDARPSTVEEGPGRIRRFLSDLASRVIPSADDESVFAYHAPAEDFQRKDGADGEKESDNNEEGPADDGSDGIDKS